MEPVEPAPANFSLHVAGPAGARASRDFHLLYRGVTSVVRTRDLRRLVDGLLAYLSGVVEEADDRSLRLEVLAFVKDGAAVLAPAELRSAMPSIERRLRSKGLRVVDRPWVRVDPVRAELLVTEPALSVDRAALDELGGDDTGTDPSVAAGRYPIAGWGFGAGPGQSGPISRALAVTLAGDRLVDRSRMGPQLALEGLARVMGQLRPVALWSDRREDLVGPLVSLAD